MEFHNNHMHTTPNVRLLYETEYEDDAFYDELRRQVLQLTEEDDDDDAAEYLTENKKIPYLVQHKEYFNWQINEDYEAPAWISKLWTSGSVSGTGVFIPQVVSKPRRTRRNRHRKKKNERDGTKKTVETIIS